ncbi:MAG: hypothetical protein WBG32_11755 [Nodosilinea sp.]
MDGWMGGWVDERAVVGNAYQLLMTFEQPLSVRRRRPPSTHDR